MSFRSMKRLGILFLITFISCSYTLHAQRLMPLPRNMVNDSAHLYTPEENERIEHILRSYRDSTTREILVVTVNDFKGYDANSFATELGNQWGIGQRDVNNGIIVLLRPGNMPAISLSPSLDLEWDSARAEMLKGGNGYFLYSFLDAIVTDSTYKASKRNRAEGDYGEGYIATGRGIEGALPDVLAARIMRNVVAPFFAAHRYAEGTEAGLLAIFQSLAGDSSTISEILTSDSQNEEKGSLFGLIGFLFIGYIIMSIICAVISIISRVLAHAVQYITSDKLRSQHSFMEYWGRESWKSTKNVIKNLPTLMLSVLFSILLRGSNGGTTSYRSSSSSGSFRSSSGSFSGGGGSFGGGGGGSRF